MLNCSTARQSAGRVFAHTLLLAGTLGFALPSGADTDNEAEMVNLVIESRLQKPADQATPEERAGVAEELESIRKITELPRAQELASDPRVSAQLELSRRVLLYQEFVSDYKQRNPATDEEISELYEEQVVTNPPLEFKARHILVESQGEAIDLIKELQDGADFAQLATDRSTGPSGPSGGDLGWFTAQQMVEPFSIAVAALADGAFTTEPVQTQFGWHVILREESRSSTPPSLDSVREILKQRIEQEKYESYLESVLEESSS